MQKKKNIKNRTKINNLQVIKKKYIQIVKGSLGFTNYRKYYITVSFNAYRTLDLFLFQKLF